MEEQPRELLTQRMPFFGPFTEIGEGKFGHVYRVFDKKRNMTITLKQIQKTKMSQLFWNQEKDVLAEVSNLVYLRDTCNQYFLCFLDFLETSTHYYIITEYLDQHVSLETLIGHIQEHDPQQVFILSENLKKGLVLLHKIGIAHRDIKPSNLMVNLKTMDIKYIDFGFACHMNSCYAYQNYGSPLYTAPEIYLFSTQRWTLFDWYYTDYWSLGVALSEIVCGQAVTDLYHFKHFGKIPEHINEIEKSFVKLFDTRDLSFDLLEKELPHSWKGHPIVRYLMDTLMPMFNHPPERRQLLICQQTIVSDHMTYLPTSLALDLNLLSGERPERPEN